VSKITSKKLEKYETEGRILSWIAMKHGMSVAGVRYNQIVRHE